MEFHTWVSVFGQGEISVCKRARSADPIRQSEMTANPRQRSICCLTPHVSGSFTKLEKCRCGSVVKA